ncbi:hypothetical protein FRC02_003169 [Tulasnella sp. 418]|nr:hypothetical protein FRC02_003169 [Tulasnella sp. 418]
MKNESRKEPKHQTRSQMPRSQPPRQSARPKNVLVQRSRAARRLAELMNMPFDVFSECLRCILMSKSAKHIWRSARENQLPTLPPCPDDLSEPQYIALLFTNICQVCGANRAQRLHVTMRTRCCASCYKNHTVTLKSLVCGINLHDLDDREAQQILSAVPGEGGQLFMPHALQVQLELFSRRLSRL